MATLLCGICITRHWYGNSRVIPMAQAASISQRMVQSYGLEALTTQYALGTCVKADSCNSMTSALKFSAWASAPLETGWLLAWKVPTLKYFIALSQISTNFTSMKVVFSHSSLPIVASGSSPLARTICWMPGGPLMEPQFSNLKRTPQCSAVTFHPMTSTLSLVPVTRKPSSMKSFTSELVIIELSLLFSLSRCLHMCLVWPKTLYKSCKLFREQHTASSFSSSSSTPPARHLYH